MFVTVEKRLARIYAADLGARLILRLVRSERRKGRVRRVTVAYLGSIHEGRLPHPLPRAGFWEHVVPTIDGLGLNADQREAVLELVRQRVPQPSVAETQKERTEMRRLAAAMRVGYLPTSEALKGGQAEPALVTTS